THWLDGTPASTDDGIAGHTSSRFRQLPAASAADPGLAHRGPAGGRQNLVRRAPGDSPRFAIHGLSIGARPGIVRAHEDQAAERGLEFFGHRDSDGYRRLLVHLRIAWTCRLCGRGGFARGRTGHAYPRRNYAAVCPSPVPPPPSELFAAKTRCG